MLSAFVQFQKLLPISSAFLFFISSVTFHTYVSAGIQEETAEQYRALGYAEQQKGNLNEALTYYTKATALGMENQVIFNDMGVLYENIDMLARAEQYYLKAIDLDPDYLPAYNNLAYLYQRLGKMDKAAEYFKLRYQLGNPEENWAQKAKDELIRIDPQYADWAHTLEAEALNRTLVAKSREEFQQSMVRSQEHFKKGEQHFHNKEYEEAMKEYDLALQLTPENPKVEEARDRTVLEMAKESVRERSKDALKRLETGDTISARYEIQRILTAIPDKPILISQ
jgi:tetratricopeptide (TPR) repeat protein